MATYHNILVDVPNEKGVHAKTAGAKREKYVYQYTKHYRNKNGDARHKSRAIGKLDPKTGKMYPNDYYFEHYNIPPELCDIKILDYGYTYLTLELSRRMGLFESLEEAFGSKRALELLTISSYMIREGNVMDAIDDWQNKNYLPNEVKKLNSQTTSKAFSLITHEERMKFFTIWIEHAFKGETVCYDVTSISSYAKDMPSVARGYNRDGENLEQFNLGMFCDEVTMTPLYYQRYNGSITDKTNLTPVITAHELGLKQIKMVLDGGFWSQNCLTTLFGCCDNFTVGMPPSTAEAKKMIEDCGNGIQSYANELNGYRHIYSRQSEITMYGISRKMILYFDAYRHLTECEMLTNYIEKLKAELKKLKRYPKNKLERYTPYFTITKHDSGGGFDFAVDSIKVDAARKSKGFFLLFTTDINVTPEKTLAI